MYGGFAGTELTRTQRDPSTYVTILSGANNNYHVVSIAGCVGQGGSALLDGLTIEGGNANGPAQDDVGGGILNAGDLTLFNVIIQNCNATNGGAAIYNYGMDAMIIIEDCTITAAMSDFNPIIINVNGAKLNSKGYNSTEK